MLDRMGLLGGEACGCWFEPLFHCLSLFLFQTPVLRSWKRFARLSLLIHKLRRLFCVAAMLEGTKNIFRFTQSFYFALFEHDVTFSQSFVCFSFRFVYSVQIQPDS